MDSLEIDALVKRLMLELKLLSECLQDIAQEELPQAIARGYTPESLGAGSLKQWSYVIKTHVEAEPFIAFTKPSESSVCLYADYAVYLIDQIFSDARFVAEIQLNWSAKWVASGSRYWKQILADVELIRREIPYDQRAEAIRSAGISASSSGNHWE